MLQGGGANVMFQLADASIAVKFDGFSLTGDLVMAEGNAGQSVTFTNSVFDFVATHDNVFYMGEQAGYSFTFTNNTMAVTGYTETFQLFNDGFVNVSNNSFTGRDGTYVADDDNDVPLILNLNAVDGTVFGNSFAHVDIGNLVADHVGPLTITDNSFSDLHRDPANGLAAGIVFYDPIYDGQIAIMRNTFSDADAGIRTSGGGTSPTLVDAPIYIDANAFSNVANPYYDAIPGELTATNSTIDGVLIAYSGSDGDDTVFAVAGDDRYDGGAGPTRCARRARWSRPTSTTTR